LARTNQLMIPQVWRSPGPDVCKTIQHLCLIKLISANKWVLSLAKMPVSDSCGLQQAKKGFHSAHKDIDKCCKIVLIIRKFKCFLGFEPRSWTKSRPCWRGSSKDKSPPPWARYRRYKHLGCRTAVRANSSSPKNQEGKRSRSNSRTRNDMRRLGLLLVFVLVCGIGQYLHATSCVDETDQEGGECKTSTCALPCDQTLGGGGIGGVQVRRFPVSHILPTTAQIAITLNPTQRSVSSSFPSEVHTPFIFLCLSPNAGDAHHVPSQDQTWTIAPTDAIFKQAAANSEVWQLKSWRV